MCQSKFHRCIRRFLLLFFPCFVWISLSDAAVKDQVYEKVLPNGLKVILLQNRTAPLVTFQVWYRVGSRNEEWGKTGLSHMLEHMMFKGTEKIAPEDFSRIVQENGGNSNAFTSNDFTAYFENLSADKVQIGIDLESDRMQNLSLNEKDFLTERMVVMEERRLRTMDNPRSYLIEQMNATAFQTSPYHWPTIGWKEDIEKFTLDDVKAYYKKYYNPANAFLVVVGDFDRDDLLSRIEKAFAPIPGGTAPDQKKDIDAPQSGERRVFVKREAELPYIVMSYHIPNLKNPDGYVLEVIAAILSGGKSSRLYQNLVLEKKLVIEANADNSLLSHDPDLFSLSAEPLPGKQVDDIENALNREIEQLQGEPVPEHEIEKAKNQIEASFVYGQDSRFFQAMLLAQYEITSGWQEIDDYLPSVRKVTPEDIQRVAKKYLIPDNRTVGILIPVPHEEQKPSVSSAPLRERMIR
jgi:zinc protease